MAKITFTKKEFDEMKMHAESAYKNFGKVMCPYLHTDVSFNAKGLDHLKLKRWNHSRPESDQFMRLKLLYLVPQILKVSHTLQGVKTGNRLERVKVNSRWESQMVPVTYYEFIAVQNTVGGGQCRLRIVVKQIENNPPYFWSIIPYWKQGAYTKEMFEGNPEED